MFTRLTQLLQLNQFKLVYSSEAAAENPESQISFTTSISQGEVEESNAIKNTPVCNNSCNELIYKLKKDNLIFKTAFEELCIKLPVNPDLNTAKVTLATFHDAVEKYLQTFSEEPNPIFTPSSPKITHHSRLSVICFEEVIQELTAFCLNLNHLFLMNCKSGAQPEYKDSNVYSLQGEIMTLSQMLMEFLLDNSGIVNAHKGIMSLFESLKQAYIELKSKLHVSINPIAQITVTDKKAIQKQADIFFENTTAFIKICNTKISGSISKEQIQRILDSIDETNKKIQSYCAMLPTHFLIDELPKHYDEIIEAMVLFLEELINLFNFDEFFISDNLEKINDFLYEFREIYLSSKILYERLNLKLKVTQK